ncbi:WbqC family protein [Flavobacteriaceae bacterium]|nr:WbqC family protein [Flavobacteriaceae bacterium]
MILTAHQPAYLPWAGLIHKIYLADVYVYFEKVQYVPKDFINRNLIFLNNKPLWLTVPVFTKGHRQKSIYETKINNQSNWRRKHLASIKLAYQKTIYFDPFFKKIESILLSDWEFLTELNLSILILTLSELDIKTKILRAKDYSFNGQKSELILDMCKQLNAKKYIFGEVGKNYADINSFKKNRIELQFQTFEPPYYKINDQEINKNLSIVDMIFRFGPEETMNLILKKNLVK